MSNEIKTSVYGSMSLAQRNNYNGVVGEGNYKVACPERKWNITWQNWVDHKAGKLARNVAKISGVAGPLTPPARV